MRKFYILLFFSLLASLSFAQDGYCPSVFTHSQMAELKAFQQKLEQGLVSHGKKAIQYIPLKVNILGNSKGVGYYQVGHLMTTLCELNARFVPLGFHFYLGDSISYLNDDPLYQGNSDAIWDRAEQFKLPGMVNVFFHGTGALWCGVYFGGVDVVFIKNSCQLSGSTTLTHELGHFFGMPHTFYGWENGNTPGQIEKIDKTNCRNAGDGFCDTKADYVSTRWGCPLGWNLKDPNGVYFKPDSSLYMNYASDQCQSRFSQEQILAMQNNLQSRAYAKSTADTRRLLPPQKMSPAKGDSNLNAHEVHLTWKRVEGAFAYQVQVARFGDWNYLNFERLVYDTTLVADLFGNWSYAWRVKAITAANTCSDFGVADTFFTKEYPAGYLDLQLSHSTSVYPNPIRKGEMVFIRNQGEVKLSIYQENGSLLKEIPFFDNQELTFQLEASGVYFLRLETKESVSFKRLLVLDN